jgi:ABC-type Zn uptake system ZnuABC Zn-binding protein ZnuA
MSRRYLSISLLGMIAVAATALVAAPAQPLKVVTSFFPVYALAVNVAGDRAEVTNLLPAGVGPHEYQLAPHDLRKISGASLVLIHGLGVESWLAPALKNAGLTPDRVVEVTAGLRSELIFPATSQKQAGEGKETPKHDQHPHEGPNAHTWLDPQLMLHGVSNVLAAFQRVDPAGAAVYATNAARYADRLRKLDTELAAQLTPVRERAMITFHDAFPYFIRRYGLRLAGVIEEAPDVEPSPRYLAELYRTARKVKVRALFTEPQSATKLARRIGQDLGIAVAELDPMETGELTPRAYEELMRRNAQTLIHHLR